MPSLTAQNWVETRPRPLRGLLAIGAGCILALGHAPFHLPWLALFGLPLIYMLWRAAPTTGRAAAAGWLGGVGYFGLTLTWIIEPFLVDIARHGFLAPFALFGMAAGLSLFWAAGAGLARRLAGRPETWVGPVALAAGIALGEYARSVLLTGFPWALPAYIWVDTSTAQTAAWLGPHGLGLLTLLLGLFLGMQRPPVMAAALAGFAALAWSGTLRTPPEDAPDRPVVRLVQPNAAQHLKWRADMMEEFYRRQIAATMAPASDAPDVVIWPESAVPFLLGTRPDLRANISAAAGNAAPVILGIRRRDDAGNWFNTLAAFGSGGEILASYDKNHLVPFGEYMPGAAIMRRLGLDGLADGLVGGFSSGPGPTRIKLDGLPSFQPLICYEMIFPHQILRGPARPAWLLQITNDAWFGTRSGPFQHLDQARMRAIEQGLPVARAANTGISAMIGPTGRVTAMLDLGEQGYVDAPLPAPLPPTLYSRTGDLPALLAIMALLGVARLSRTS